MTSSLEKRRRAEERFHQTIKKAQEAKQAISQYEAAARAVDEKTARLRAQRLAKEAADVKEAVEKKSAKKPAIAPTNKKP
jgi:hypothetical protein